MEHGRLDKVDALRMGLPDLACPELPCRTPVVGYERDSFCGCGRGGREVCREKEIGRERVPYTVKSPDYGSKGFSYNV